MLLATYLEGKHDFKGLRNISKVLMDTRDHDHTEPITMDGNNLKPITMPATTEISKYIDKQSRHIKQYIDEDRVA